MGGGEEWGGVGEWLLNKRRETQALDSGFGYMLLQRNHPNHSSIKPQVILLLSLLALVVGWAQLGDSPLGSLLWLQSGGGWRWGCLEGFLTATSGGCCWLSARTPPYGLSMQLGLP